MAIRISGMLTDYLIYFLHIHILTDMVGKTVVLLLFESMVVKGGAVLSQLIGKGLQKIVDERGVVENAMDIGTHTVVVHQVTVFRTILQVQ